MVCSKVMGKLVYSNKQLDFIELEWFERNAPHLTKNTVGGKEVTLEYDIVLGDRDIIFEDEKDLIAVKLLPCRILSSRVNRITEAGRACYLLGLAGLPVSIDAEWIKAPYDERAAKLLKEKEIFYQVTEEIFEATDLPTPEYSDIAR